MNKTFKLLILFSILVLTSCKNDKKPGDMDLIILENNYQYQKITGSTIEIDSFAFPGRSTMIDSFLIIEDSKSDKPLHLFDFKNKKHLKTFGFRGKGPGEFIGLNSISVFGNKIWAFDISLGKNVSFVLDSVLNSENYKYSDEIVYQDEARRCYGSIWLDQNIAVSPTSGVSKYRLQFIDKKGQIIREEFEMFPPPSENIPLNIHNQSYDGVLKKHPSQDLTVMVNRYSDQLEIYDISSKKSIRLKTHSNYEPVYVIDDSAGFARMAQGDDMRFGYIDVSVTDNKIFSLFSGKTRGESKRAYCGSKIVLYDWKGNYLTSYLIEGDALSIQATSENEFFTLEMQQGKVVLKKYNI